MITGSDTGSSFAIGSEIGVDWDVGIIWSTGWDTGAFCDVSTGAGVDTTAAGEVSVAGSATTLSNGSYFEFHPHFNLQRFSSFVPSHPSIQILFHKHEMYYRLQIYQ